MSTSRFAFSLALTAIIAACTLASGACSSSDTSSSGPATCPNPGGPVAGSDKHCGSTVVKVDPNACNAMGGAGGAGGGAGGAGGQGGAGGAETSDYGPTMVGTEGDDDDCKYHLSWTSSQICEGGGVSISMVITYKDGGMPVAGAAPYIDVLLGDMHPAPMLGQIQTVETSPGHYTFSPVDFDAPGQWTVRAHLFGEACDATASPHGHAAFFVQVN